MYQCIISFEIMVGFHNKIGMSDYAHANPTYNFK